MTTGRHALARPGRLAPDAWLDAVIDRHTASFSTGEFLKAVRALSARYVERRAELPARSPLDSAGKRAAFAGFFALLHYTTLRQVIAGLAADTPVVGVHHVLDLGCGTGVAAAAWVHAIAAPHAVRVEGIDHDSWVLNEARWNWGMIGIDGRTRRASLVGTLAAPARAATDPGVAILAWSANELTTEARARVLGGLRDWHARGGRVLVVEPLARIAAPWWDEWAATLITTPGARADEWKFPAALPPRLAALDEAAGFRRDVLSARTIWLP